MRTEVRKLLFRLAQMSSLMLIPFKSRSCWRIDWGRSLSATRNHYESMIFSPLPARVLPVRVLSQIARSGNSPTASVSSTQPTARGDRTTIAPGKHRRPGKHDWYSLAGPSFERQLSKLCAKIALATSKKSPLRWSF